MITTRFLGRYRNEIDDQLVMPLVTNRKEYESVPHAMLRTVFASVSFMAIATMQDLLELDGSARMNFPSTLGGSWAWRMTGSNWLLLLGRIAWFHDHLSSYQEFSRIRNKTLSGDKKYLPLKEFVQKRYNKSITQNVATKSFTFLTINKLANSQNQ